MQYDQALLVAARVAQQTGKPQFVVGRANQWAVGNYPLKPTAGFTVEVVVPHRPVEKGNEKRSPGAVVSVEN